MVALILIFVFGPLVLMILGGAIDMMVHFLPKVRK